VSLRGDPLVHGPELQHREWDAIEPETTLAEEDWAAACKSDDDCNRRANRGRGHDENAREKEVEGSLALGLDKS
jgi:hypothetical protein